jgi:hypothetical protein
MNAATKTETTALALASAASAGALLMDSSSMDRLERIADLMASGKTTVPQHLRGSKGDCFAVCLQSMQWGMNPFAVAQKTHLVNGTLGYEAQLVAAVINNSGVVKDRFHFEWFGPWEKIIGKFKEVESKTKKDDNGYPKKYIVPAWKQEDEHGLGVRVWATIKGESEPRHIELLMTQARTRNSTLWTEDPKQQLAYLAQKRWSRLYAPDVILGVYTPDELDHPQEKFMGMVDEVKTKPKTYDQSKFDANLPEWTAVIQSGRKTAEDFINFADKRGEPYTDGQKKALRAVNAAKDANVTDVHPKAESATAEPGQQQRQPTTYAQVAERITKAKSQQELDGIDELIGAVESALHREELTAVLSRRQDELPPF